MFIKCKKNKAYNTFFIKILTLFLNSVTCYKQVMRTSKCVYNIFPCVVFNKNETG